MHLKGKVRQNLFLVKLTNCRGRFHKPIYALRQAFTPNFYEGLLRRNNLAQCVRNWPSEKKHALCILWMVFMAGAGQYSGRTFVSPEKTAVQSPPQIFLFRPNNINLQCLKKYFTLLDNSFNLATSTRKKLYATNLLLYEEKRSLRNWSYDVTATWSGISTRYEAYGWKLPEMTKKL